MSTISLEQNKDHQRRKITILDIQRKKDQGEVITALTGYDYPTALALDSIGIDAILVGDSLSMVVLGYENTLSVTLDEMLHHCKAVARGAKNALLIGDMPFMSYQVSISESVRNAGRFLQEGGMDAVKLEGGQEKVETIRAIVNAGIPVMGHIGLTPQSFHSLGGFRPQGKTAESAMKIFRDAKFLEEAGCFSLVLESIPSQLAKLISENLSIPTIGIGAGKGCNGQILVSHDMLGLFDRFTPRFVKKYANLQELMKSAFSTYKSDVSQRNFPGQEHSIEMTPNEWESFLAMQSKE